MLELLGGLLWGMVVPGLVGNRFDAGVCSVFARVRDRTFKPTPENHDLQRALLEALRDGVETAARKARKQVEAQLSRPEKKQIETWRQQQVKAINKTLQEIQTGHFQLGGDEDWSLLLRAGESELQGLSQRQVNAQLRQLKERLEAWLQVETLPVVFREEFTAEWLAWVNLYLAESVKTNGRVAEILQVELLLDAREGIQQLIEQLSNPQEFLGAVQLIDFNIAQLREELELWQQDLTGHLEALQAQLSSQMGAGFGETNRRLEGVVQLLLRMQRAETATVSTSVITVPPNLEHWLGRETEVRQLEAWLAEPQVDTIGIQGLGGVGKSALASRIYHQATGFVAKFWADVSQQPDFLVFAEQAILALSQRSALDLAQLNATQLSNLLLAALNEQRCLLVVDNLETLLDGARGWQDPAYEQFFTRWTQQGHTSVLVVTTREKPHLLQPEPNWLVLQGLREQNGGLLLRELGVKGNETQLRELAAAVDGHPLTLYLSAGFLREYCDGQLARAAELGLSEFKQLADAALGSHRDQQAVQRAWILQQHLDRLTPELRQLLEALTVYRQPFSQAAAAFMLTETEEPASPLVAKQALQELLNRSLLVQLEDRHYQLLPSVADYVQEQAQNTEVAHQQAVRYYASIAPSAEQLKVLADLTPWLEAFHHYCEQGQAALAADTLQKTWTFISRQGYSTLWLEVGGRLVALLEGMAEPTRDDRVRLGWALSRLAQAHYNLSQYPESRRLAERQLALACTLEEPSLAGDALRALGNAYNSQSQYQRAIEFYEQWLAIAREIGDRAGEAGALGGLGNAYNSQSQYQRAIEFYEQRLAIAREIGDRAGEANALGGLGNAYLSQSQYQRAIEFYEQHLAIAREIGDRAGEALALDNLGNTSTSLGKIEAAIDYYQQALPLAREIGDRRLEGYVLGHWSIAEFAEKHYQKALDYSQQTLTLAQSIGEPFLAAYFGHYRGGMALAQLRRRKEAKQWLYEAYRTFKALGTEHYVAYVWQELTRLGESHASDRELPEALDIYQSQLQALEQLGDRPNQGWVYQNIGKAYYNQQDYPQAIAAHQKMLDIAKTHSDPAMENFALAWLGCSYRELKQTEPALDCFQQRLAIATAQNDRNSQRETLKWLVDLTRPNPTVRIAYARDYIALLQDLGDREELQNAFYTLAMSHYDSKNYPLAIQNLNQALELAIALEKPGNIANAHYMLGQSHRQLGDQQAAIDAYQAAEQQYEIANNPEWAKNARDWRQKLAT